MGAFRSWGTLTIALLTASACMPASTSIGLKPESIPAQGIYAPQDVVVAPHGGDGSFEFAAAGVPSFAAADIKQVAACRASMFAAHEGFSGWFEKETIDTPAPQLHQVTLIATFYRGEKPYLVHNENLTDWCHAQPAPAAPNNWQ